MICRKYTPQEMSWKEILRPVRCAIRIGGRPITPPRQQFLDAQESRFSWTPAPNADFHNVYRGTIAGPMGSRLPGSVYDHICFESADAQTNGDLKCSDPAIPPLGTAYYYLTSGERCGEGALDTDAPHLIPNPSSCPTPP
jgi:hypothetical protein